MINYLLVRAAGNDIVAKERNGLTDQSRLLRVWEKRLMAERAAFALLKLMASKLQLQVGQQYSLALSPSLFLTVFSTQAWRVRLICFQATLSQSSMRLRSHRDNGNTCFKVSRTMPSW